MSQGNVRARERADLALGGGQIAALILGALVALAAVFFLGLEVGQRVGTRRAEAARPASLGELDAAQATARKLDAGKDLTFPAELPRAKPAEVRPEPEARPVQARRPEPVPAPPPASQAAAEAPPPPAPIPPSPAAETPAPAPAPAEARPAPAGGWTVQLGASQRREEAEALARKVQGLGPRVEAADVAGKGHFFRVRVGRFDTKPAAEKYREDVIRETGLAGVIVPR